MFAINRENLKKSWRIIYLKKNQVFLLFTVSVVMNISGLINNIEEYEKIYNHIWRKQESRI